MNSVTLTLYRLGPYMILSSVKNNTLSVKLTLPILLCGDKGKLGIIHYVTEDHTLPDFKVFPITTNSSRNERLVARRRMTNENICVLKSAENIKHVCDHNLCFSVESVSCNLQTS